MADFYDEMALMALEMIAEFGEPVPILDIIKGAYDPSTSKMRPDSVVERTAQGILLDFTGQELLIKVCDKKLTIAASGRTSPPTLLSKVSLHGL